MRRGPTFIIAGAPRSGTTWLYHLLDRHPEVYMARPARPEPKFFLVDDAYARGLDYYLDTWFADADRFTAAGEKTTNYLESAAAAERIREHLPRVKLVFILREPADRACSNWAWSRMNRHETEDFETALSLEEQRERDLPHHLRFARPHAYFSRGLYARMLAPYFARFSPDQVLCLNFDDIVSDPADLATRLHRFIGVTPRPEDAAGLDVVNPSESGGALMPDEVRVRLRARYADANRELARLLGQDFASWVRA